jgi:hypothetical protein
MEGAGIENISVDSDTKSSLLALEHLWKNGHTHRHQAGLVFASSVELTKSSELP